MSSLFITLQNSPCWAPSEFNILQLVVPRTKTHSDSSSYYVLHTYYVPGSLRRAELSRTAAQAVHCTTAGSIL